MFEMRIHREQMWYFADVGDPRGVEVEARLAELWDRGRTVWPDIDLSVEAFARHLLRRAPDGGLDAINAPDLYLAVACAEGSPEALEAFDRTVLSRVPRALAKLDPSPAFADEVIQLLRERLLCATPNEEPRIVQYAGVGALVAWVRVVAMRTALNLRRANRRELIEESEDPDETAMRASTPEEDPELAYIRTRHQKDFEQALREALATLSSEQRNVFRLRFAAGLTGEQIATMLRISRATVTRWLATIRGVLRDETVRRLRERLQLSPAEAESMIRMVRSQLHLSMGSLFGSDGRHT